VPDRLSPARAVSRASDLDGADQAGRCHLLGKK
jgi:hypothetical protein